VSVPVPVETGVVVGVSLGSEEITEHSTKVGNVGLGLEFKRAAVGKVFGELTGAALAEGRDSDTLLLFHNELVLLGGGLGLESLPGESALEEVYEDVSNGLEIITSRLLHTQVVIDGSITRSTGQRTSFSLGNVLKGSRVTVSLGKSEIDTVDKVSVSTSSISHKVSRLNITVDQVARVHQFYTLQHLISDHKNGLERKSSTTFVELIFQRGSKKVHDHEIVGILCSKVMNFGETRSILQFTVYLIFVTQLRTSSSVLFELDSHLLVIMIIYCKKGRMVR
jgi:hypothetical protein